MKPYAIVPHYAFWNEKTESFIWDHGQSFLTHRDNPSYKLQTKVVFRNVFTPFVEVEVN